MAEVKSRKSREPDVYQPPTVRSLGLVAELTALTDNPESSITGN